MVAVHGREDRPYQEVPCARLMRLEKVVVRVCRLGTYRDVCKCGVRCEMRVGDGNVGAKDVRE